MLLPQNAHTATSDHNRHPLHPPAFLQTRGFRCRRKPAFVTLQEPHQQLATPLEAPPISPCPCCLDTGSPRNAEWGNGLEAHKSNGHRLWCCSSGSISSLVRVNMAANEKLSETVASALCYSNIAHGSYILGLIMGKHSISESGLLLGSFTGYIRGKRRHSLAGASKPKSLC